MLHSMNSRETFRYEEKQKERSHRRWKKYIRSANENILPDKTYDRIEK